MDESRGTVGGGGGSERNCLRPARGAVNDSQKISKTGRGREGADKVNVKMRKALIRNRNMLRRDLRVAVDLGSLAGNTGAAPSSDVTGEMWPNITGRKEAASGTDARMSQVVNMMKNGFTQRMRNEGVEVAGRNITMEKNVTKRMLGMLESGGME